MSKLEKINLEPQISPEQELTEREEEVIRKTQKIFEENAKLSKELLNEDDLNLSPEEIQKLNSQLGEIGAETKGVLGELKRVRAKSHVTNKAA
ncbi:MAG: hypothetical protein COZ28_02015 [Candidatus Moranbacteria bacterium CG_4_10_14_3_um_filter_44_15]|nr:MAG: hypothetical protein COS72_00620 [Candidatus Moranbacteria bacterium CG06_land_8_20_14_3_00_43_56]PIV83811.1 MAG: hypothetical protein COW51_02715 [Candidatus Moranbacteria bacterium CG17_big_fil_post_rev_8_21_14_2_50_44_12]PIW93128.1 MAG: hypothetical protein COZ87_03130 [Candidatus Moranbacteria bacterium CG_4_8_14_3_um_filter_43_15]PIX90748.1 MAG: hypothetical protein COZ28_02015 [Candidatus Moranbacteria bacterium CG_4_10_14_3_um_filter_44_15]PJA86313.1 MAG: hypothetical protein CO1